MILLRKYLPRNFLLRFEGRKGLFENWGSLGKDACVNVGGGRTKRCRQLSGEGLRVGDEGQMSGEGIMMFDRNMMLMKAGV